MSFLSILSTVDENRPRLWMGGFVGEEAPWGSWLPCDLEGRAVTGPLPAASWRLVALGCLCASPWFCEPKRCLKWYHEVTKVLEIV